MQIIINDWKELSVEKYVAKEPFEKGETFIIDWTKEIETFTIIQEINCSDAGFLSLSGFSKDSNSWLTYKFKNYKCDIEADKINNLDKSHLHST